MTRIWHCLGSTMPCVSMARAASVTEHGGSDHDISTRVQALFAAHPDLAVELTVSVRKGVVYINGMADTDLTKRNAELLAASVEGVKRVVDNAGVDN